MKKLMLCAGVVILFAGFTACSGKWKVKTEKFGSMDMVYIEGGTFIMGSPESEKGRDGDEKQHEVTVSAFWMGKYEVTQQQYVKIMGTNPSDLKGENLPVETVSWYDAVEFCNKLSEKEGLKPYYQIDKNKKDKNNKNKGDGIKWTVTIIGGNGFRLPTEAEWEYACRAGTTTAFCYGDSLDSSMANCSDIELTGEEEDIYRKKITEVGSFKPNAWGLYDMHGNVNEWCWDWNGEYGRGSVKDPIGAENGEYRILRGGCCGDVGDRLRSACRGWRGASEDSVYGGFRVVRSSN